MAAISQFGNRSPGVVGVGRPALARRCSETAFYSATTSKIAISLTAQHIQPFIHAFAAGSGYLANRNVIEQVKPSGAKLCCTVPESALAHTVMSWLPKPCLTGGATFGPPLSFQFSIRF
jgi:hypothetical protein